MSMGTFQVLSCFLGIKRLKDCFPLPWKWHILPHLLVKAEKKTPICNTIPNLVLFACIFTYSIWRLAESLNAWMVFKKGTNSSKMHQTQWHNARNSETFLMKINSLCENNNITVTATNVVPLTWRIFNI